MGLEDPVEPRAERGTLYSKRKAGDADTARATRCGSGSSPA